MKSESRIFGLETDLRHCRLLPSLVLVILDRNVDLVPMLSHSWTYQALVHDVLDMKLNRVSVEVSLSLSLSSVVSLKSFS